MCSVCHEVKPIYSFDFTTSGKRRESVCKSCVIDQFKPKKKPKIVGQGKPIFGFGKLHDEHIDELIYEKEGEVMHENLKNWVSEYVRSKGDGFTAKEFAKHYDIQANAVYYKLNKLVETKQLFKSGGEVLRYFLKKENYDYYVKNKAIGRRKDAVNKKVLQIIKNGDVSKMKDQEIELDEPPKEKEKGPKKEKEKEPIAQPISIKHGRILKDGTKEEIELLPKKPLNVADAIDTLIQIRIEKAIDETIDKKINVAKKEILEMVSNELPEIKKALKDIDDKLDTTKIAKEVIQIMKEKLM